MMETPFGPASARKVPSVDGSIFSTVKFCGADGISVCQRKKKRKIPVSKREGHTTRGQTNRNHPVRRDKDKQVQLLIKAHGWFLGLVIKQRFKFGRNLYASHFPLRHGQNFLPSRVFPPRLSGRVAPVSEQEVAIKILNYNDKLILRPSPTTVARGLARNSLMKILFSTPHQGDEV